MFETLNFDRPITSAAIIFHIEAVNSDLRFTDLKISKIETEKISI